MLLENDCLNQKLFQIELFDDTDIDLSDFSNQLFKEK